MMHQAICVVMGLLIVVACSQEEAPKAIDREALKAELRAELLAEIRGLLSEQDPTPVSGDELADDPAETPSEPEAVPTHDDGSDSPAAVDLARDFRADSPVEPVEEPGPAKPSTDPPEEKPAVVEEPGIVPIESPHPPPEVAPHPSLAVLRLEVATDVNREQREPENVGIRFSLAQTSLLYAYMAIQNKGNPVPILVEWYRAGTRRSQITLNVGHSIRGWRTWSKVRLGAKDGGPWEVHVLDDKGRLLQRAAFEVTP